MEQRASVPHHCTCRFEMFGAHTAVMVAAMLLSKAQLTLTLALTLTLTLTLTRLGGKITDQAGNVPGRPKVVRPRDDGRRAEAHPAHEPPPQILAVAARRQLHRRARQPRAPAVRQVRAALLGEV